MLQESLILGSALQHLSLPATEHPRSADVSLLGLKGDVLRSLDPRRGTLQQVDILRVSITFIRLLFLLALGRDSAERDPRIGVSIEKSMQETCTRSLLGTRRR